MEIFLMIIAVILVVTGLFGAPELTIICVVVGLFFGLMFNKIDAKNNQIIDEQQLETPVTNITTTIDNEVIQLECKRKQ